MTLAKLSIRRPKAALAIWLTVATVLSLLGLGVSGTLSPSITVVPGTQSSRAQQLGNAQFVPTQLVPILLEGPKAQLDRQGPALVAAVASRAHTRVLSPWDAGTASTGLRPRPTAATIIVSVDRSEKDAVRYDEPQIESLVARKITAPVKSYITGQPSIDRAEKDASLSNLRQDELIAVGILFLLLLVGLRAPVDALLVTAVGAISTLSGFGEVALLGHMLQLDPVGVAAGTMTGLALGVGFALLILDRFHREELPEGRHPRDATTAAIRELATTGKAVLVGGTALILALALVAVIGPTQLMVSVGTGALTCAAFTTGGAVVVMPAALVLLGRRIDAFSFPTPAALARGWSRLADGGNWVTRHAVYAGFAATALLAAIAVPALALKSGPPDVSQLPAGAKARIAFEEVSRVMGPGWATPYNLIVVANDRPLTTPALLESMYRFQLRIAKDNRVDSVTGPGAINSTSAQLSTRPQLQASAKISDQSKVQLLQLVNGLRQAGAGSAQLQSGLAAASTGAGQLYSGSGQAQSGAGQLHSGLAQAKAGSAQLQAGLNAALTGAVALKNGAGQALAGSGQLATGLGQTAPQVAAGLPSVGQLASGGSQLTSGLNQLTAGAGALQIGLGQLTIGTGQLATGLEGGVGPAGQLTTGLGTMQAAVVKARVQIPSTAQLKQLEQQSPGIFNSGYFVLAAARSNRNAATFTINLLRGGTAGQIMVVSKYKSSDPRTEALGNSLANLGQKFATQKNVQVAVGGPAGNFGDLTSVTKSRIWLDVAVVSAAIVLLLALALRAVLLPAAAAVFGRYGWWPTSAPRPTEPAPPTGVTRRMPRLRLPHGRPGPAHQ